MARPRRADDDELLQRIVAALEQRTDTSAWTLSDVAPAAGISPAGLIKRFGSKTGLLRALTRRWVDSIPQRLPEGADAAVVLEEYVSTQFGARSPDGALFALSEILGELGDPELTVLLAEGWRRQAGWLALLLGDLHLPRLADPESGATLLLDALHGTLFRAAVGSDRTSPRFTLDRFLEVWK
jgi:AcrR family transcriptional regulator